MKRKFFKAVNLAAFSIYNRIAPIFLGLDGKKAAFLSESHLSLDGNLKAVHDALGDGYEKRVHVKADRRQGDRLKDKLSLWKDITTAGYIFLDDFFGLTSAMKLRKNQELIQLWHGSGAFKKFGFSRIDTGDNIRNVNTGYRKYTKVSVTSETVRPCFAEAFDVPASRVKAAGSPRTDMFFDEAEIVAARQRVYSAYPALQGKKVVLIAPTYRGRKVEDASYDFDKLDLKRLSAELGKDYHIVTKWHPALYNNIKRGLCPGYPEMSACKNVTDLSGYGDINDVLTVTDVLVTDYSSVIFDYFLLDKPVVYFIYDEQDYSQNRGLYFDFQNYLYGRTACSFDDLLAAIKAEDLCEDLRGTFNEKFMKACDGQSTARVIEWVFE